MKGLYKTQNDSSNSSPDIVLIQKRERKTPILRYKT